jgi:OOP family OmpA-OmpF porin
VNSLTQLAELIDRNPRANFVIEGHTDNFGTPEYNMRLSLARAESVKAWLVSSAGIDETRIQARGLGMTHLLVPGGSVEAQQLNRRVEIVIKTNRTKPN